jgi:hypothetical protein
VGKKDSSRTRRDFLKTIGAAAISTAAASAGALQGCATSHVASQQRVRVVANKRRMMEQLRDDGLMEIQRTLIMVLKTFPAEVKQANLRLNVSDKDEPHPVFVGWVGPEIMGTLIERTDDPRLKEELRDVGLYRLGDGIPSDVYQETFTAQKKRIVERDWYKQLAEKKIESKLLVQKAGLMYQRFAGIYTVADGITRCVGMLTISLKDKPSQLDMIDRNLQELTDGERKAKSPLLDMINNRFVLQGRRIS